MSDKIGRYEILEEIGKGAMGLVYKARDTIIDRVVAIKTIKMGKNESAKQLSDSIKLFYQEARIAGKLQHPNIATIYDVGEEKGVNYLVFEYVRGITLKSIIAQKKNIPLHEKIEIIILISRALHYAHQRGVIHRDIKPANIMLLNDKQIKILDFGIAMIAFAEDIVYSTHSGSIIGTPSYMSPEQVNGLELDKQTDIFSLGALAYEFVSYKRPFLADNLSDLSDKILHEEPLPINDISSECYKDLNALILKALNKDKHKRYKSASEFADALDIYLNDAQCSKAEDGQSNISYDKKSLISTLKQRYTFFADFSDEELLKVFKKSNRRVCKKGEIIFREGSIGDKLYIIITGIVLITKNISNKDRDMLLATIKQGDCFGEMAIMDNSPRFATAKAGSDCYLLEINEAVLRNAEPIICLKLYRNLGSILSDKLRKSDEKIAELWTKLKEATSKNAPSDKFDKSATHPS
ncbi:serine/threonine protein kinase with PASTA sensor(s) [Candidatus Magnetoovum chiemensis]|nr:serine/threonine protein kinase with PASTA sensor(s) [Candidatus Magnetoovum chiemensis]